MIGGHAWLYGNWIVDDAAITFAYARSISEGLGPVVAPGSEAVEGFSNPTWTLLLTVGRLLGLFDRGLLFGVPDYVLFPKLLGLLFCAGILVACHLAAKAVTRYAWLVTLAVGAVLSVIPSFVIWSFSGLENSLFAFLVTCLAVVLFRATLAGTLLTPKVAVWAGVLAALAALTRPDGMIYVGAYGILVLLRIRRNTVWPSVRNVLWSLAAFAVPYGLYVLWRFIEFGRLLPNTAVAKNQQLPEPEDLTRSSDLVGYIGAPFVLVVALVAGIALARQSARRAALVAPMVPLVLAALTYSVLEPDWMEQLRFATPFWALAALTGALVTTEALRDARGRVLVLLALVVAGIPSLALSVGHAREFRGAPTIPTCYIADRFGRVFNSYADILELSEASVLEPDLGGSSLTSRLHIVDMAGLADSKIAEFYRGDRDMPGLRNYVYETVKPTFIHSRGPWGPGTGIARDPRLGTDYYPILRYGDEDLPVGDGDWVRKDAVLDQVHLDAVRAYAADTVPAIDGRQLDWPLRSCGDVLRPGQTEVNLT
ncbi:hypothetical protein FPZ12_022350 [Amycolatopsis acidicola]|uniref:Glycosyltransferase RgtA/B/C/D-like domain-containing protein n=1 Tax=Amycolatopsis acidicola TaxID=2596893 RepID=A0A5N0UZM5_9PSEU|nr:hypothetical protein FPZ12_022350 [Amycolatopsis acidicola]